MSPQVDDDGTGWMDWIVYWIVYWICYCIEVGSLKTLERVFFLIQNHFYFFGMWLAYNYLAEQQRKDIFLFKGYFHCFPAVSHSNKTMQCFCCQSEQKIEIAVREQHSYPWHVWQVDKCRWSSSSSDQWRIQEWMAAIRVYTPKICLDALIEDLYLAY